MKNSSFVKYPVDSLDMRPYVLGLKDAPEPILYDLYGVSIHFGSLNGGHYTATCRNHESNEWYYFNDSLVSHAIQTDIVSKSAYILFYRRRK